jgi:hypothetical protein
LPRPSFLSEQTLDPAKFGLVVSDHHVDRRPAAPCHVLEEGAVSALCNIAQVWVRYCVVQPAQEMSRTRFDIEYVKAGGLFHPIR